MLVPSLWDLGLGARMAGVWASTQRAPCLGAASDNARRFLAGANPVRAGLPLVSADEMDPPFGVGGVSKRELLRGKRVSDCALVPRNGTPSPCCTEG